MTVLRVAGLALLCALLTWVAGWWAVLVVALVAGALWRRDDAVRLVTISALLAWCAWLVADALDGELGAVSHVVGRVFGAPGFGMLVLTLLFIAGGAWSAATIGASLARHLFRARPVKIAGMPVRNE